MRDDPWDSIAPAPAQLVGHRIEGRHSLDVYWARDSDGSAGIMFKGVDPGGMPDDRPRMRKVDLVLQDGPPVELALFLRDPEHKEMFHLLCRDIVDASARAAEPASATRAIFRRLAHWQAMLAAGPMSELSAQEVRGVMGELRLLDTLRQHMGIEAALAAWVAPDDHPQDFALPKGIIEVKARLAGSRPLVMISSLEQLETGHLPLVLLVVELTPDGDGASLNAMVDDLLSHAHAHGGACAESMELALLRRGYSRAERYETLRHRVSGVRAYRVDQGFPCLVRSEVDPRIRDASYQLDMTGLSHFERDFSAVLSAFVG